MSGSAGRPPGFRAVVIPSKRRRSRDTGKSRPRRFSNWAIGLPIGFVVLALAAQILLPILLRSRERTEWSELVGVLSPARGHVDDLQVTYARQSSLTRSYASRGDRSYLDMYLETRVEERREFARLFGLSERMGPATRRALEDLDAAVTRWQVRHGQLLTGDEADRAAFREALEEQDVLYNEVQAAASAVEAAIMAEWSGRLDAIRAMDRARILVSIGLGILALAAAIVVARLGITLRRLAEVAQERRRESEHARAEAERLHRRLSTLMASTRQGIYGVDRQGRCTFMNEAASAMLGYDPTEMEGRDIIRLVHRDVTGQAVDETVFERVLAKGEEVQLEDRWMQRADNSCFPVEYSASPIVAGDRILGAVVIFDDLTGRRVAERAQRILAGTGRVLTGSLDYQATLDTVARMVVPALADYCIVYVPDPEGVLRPLARAHRDPGMEEVLEEFDRGYVTDPKSGAGAVAQVWRTGRPVFEPSLTPAEREAWLRDEPEILRLAERIALRSFIAVPMTARKRTVGVMVFGRTDPSRPYTPADLELAEELGRRAGLAVDNVWLYAEATRQLRLREQVLAVVSHDLRNPLNTIGLAAGILLELSPEAREEEKERQLEVIRRAVARANRLIDDLLDVAQIESGRLRLKREALAVDSIIEEVVELHFPIAVEKGLHLETEVAQGLPPIEGDRHRIVQALSNLVGNAIKFTPKGGRVEIAAEAADGGVAIRVSDTGPGIESKDIPHLFDPYWQAARHERAGAGLGLSIVKGIATAHSGRVHVESKVGKGSTFTLEFPAAPPHTEAAD